MTIEAILLILIAVIMVISILVGLKQGLRKNSFNLCSTIIFWILFWITAPLIKGKWIWYSESFYNTISSITGETGYTNLMEMVQGLIASSGQMDPSALKDPAFENTLIAFGASILRIFYLIGLSILFAIVKSIIYSCLFKSYCKVTKGQLKSLEKQQIKYAKKHKEPSKKIEKQMLYTSKQLKKNKLFRPLGMVTGAARGLVTSLLILCLVNSTVRLFPQSNNNDPQASTDSVQETPSIYDFILDYCNNDPIVAKAIELITDYQQSSLINVTSMKIGNKTLDEAFMDSILSGKSKDYSVALRAELKAITSIAVEAFALTNGFDMESVNWTALNPYQVQNVQNILLTLSDDGLFNNLTTCMIGVAMSLDAVASYIPENFSDVEYKSINWGEELKSISSLVADVYSLGDLSNLDYFDLDPDKVEKIFTSLSELESINFLGHIGSNFAIKSLAKDDPAYEESIKNIEAKLAELAVNGDYSGALLSYKDLYRQFIDIFKDEALDNYKDENGKITSYVSALTSIDTTKYSTLVHTVLEANFVSELLPDVMDIIRENAIPEEYASLINPSVVTSTQWENEIDALLTIVRDITLEKETGVIHPFETIETYDFSLLRNFTPETVVQSDLLSYAMIKIFIDTSKNEGILGDKGNDFSKYIQVPDSLAVDADANHRFANKWYGNESNKYKDGELYVMLDTVKNCASNIDKYNNIEGSLPAMLGAIDANEIASSDVLYYSVNQLLDLASSYIIIPLDETEISADTVNGNHIDNMVKRNSLKEVLDIFTDQNIIDLESLFSYYEVDKDGNVATTPTPKDEITNMDNYFAKLEFSQDKALNLLTSKKLYNPETGNEANLNKLFGSGILRASVTNLLNTYAGEYIAIPNISSDAEECLVTKEVAGNKETVKETVKVVKQKDFKALIMAINDLSLDLNKVMENPIGVIDSLKNGDDLKPEAEEIFADNTSSKYSGILHATLSKYVIQFANDGTSSVNIVVPNESLDESEENLIKGNETVNLLKALVIVGTDAFTNSEADQNTIINDILGKVINNNNALNSDIIKATLTSFVSDESLGITLPNESFDSQITSVNVISKNHIVDLLEAVDSLKTVKNLEDPNANYSDLLDVNKLNFKLLGDADNLKGKPISSSLILRGILADQLTKNSIAVPNEAKDGEALSINETSYLIQSLSDILLDSSISNIDVSSLTVGQFNDAKNNIKQSIIVRKLFTDKLNEQAEIAVPSQAYDLDITSCDVLSQNEIDYMISGLTTLIGSDSKITAIDVNKITIGDIKASKTSISSSKVLNATIAKQLESQKGTVVVPNEAYVDATQEVKILEETEITNLIDGLAGLLGEASKVTSIDVNTITAGRINAVKANISSSFILNATITGQLNSQPSISVPTMAYVDADAKDKLLQEAELNNLIEGICVILGNDTIITNVDLNNITVGHIKLAKNNISSSNILNATITKQLDDQKGTVVVPSEAYVDSTQEIKVLEASELNNLIDGLVGLLGEASKVTSIDVNTITAGRINSVKANISSSFILNATITKQLDGQASITIPESAYIDASATDKLLEITEMNNLISGLCKILGENTVITNVGLDTIKVRNIKSSITNISASHILNATITSQLEGNLIIPSFAYINKEAVNKELLESEISNLLNGVCNLLPEDTSLTNVDINSLSIQSINNSIDNIASSYVLRTTITKHINDNATIIVPSISLDPISEAGKPMLKELEVKSLFKTVTTLFGADANLSSLNADSLTFKKINDSANELVNSYVLKATISKNIKDQETSGILSIPAASYDELAKNEILSSNEIKAMFNSLTVLFGENTSINNLSSFGGINLANINTYADAISNSYVLRATISKSLIDTNCVVIPLTSIDSEIKDMKVISKNSFKLFFNAIDTMGIADISNINASSLKLTSEKASILVASDIMRATITSTVQINGNTRVVASDTLVTKDAHNKDILVINENELHQMINAMITLSGSGSVNISFDINGLITALANGQLEAMLDSSTIRLAISDVILGYKFTVSGIEVGYETCKVLDTNMVPSSYVPSLVKDGMFYRFAAPTNVDTYLLPNGTTVEARRILTKADIVAFVTYLGNVLTA